MMKANSKSMVCMSKRCLLNSLCVQDPMIGVDTEWKPDSKIEDNDVAMFQLASSTVVILIRTCKIGFPQELIDFCRQAYLILI